MMMIDLSHNSGVIVHSITYVRSDRLNNNNNKLASRQTGASIYLYSFIIIY